MNKTKCQDVVTLNDLSVVAGFRELLVQNGLDTLDALFGSSLGEPLEKAGMSSWRERIRLELSDRGLTQTVYLKRFTNPPARARREVVRSGSEANSVAGIEWYWMHRFGEMGIPCARPVALGEQVAGGRELRSAVVMAAVPGRSLEALAAEWAGAGRAAARKLLAPLARIVSTLHGAGLVHRDLYLSHVFFEATAPPEDSLRLIDLQRVFAPATMLRRWIIKDLAALNYSTPSELVSTADRVRWLRMYLGARRLDPRARRLLYRVAGKTHRIARHDSRS